MVLQNFFFLNNWKVSGDQHLSQIPLHLFISSSPQIFTLVVTCLLFYTPHKGRSCGTYLSVSGLFTITKCSSESTMLYMILLLPRRVFCNKAEILLLFKAWMVSHYVWLLHYLCPWIQGWAPMWGLCGGVGEQGCTVCIHLLITCRGLFKKWLFISFR